MAVLEVTLSLNDQTGWYLDRLLETGLYGNKRAEAAKIVILDHFKLLIAQDKLKLAPPIPGSNAIAPREITYVPTVGLYG